MVPLFGEQPTLMAFARSWQLRERGISDIIGKMETVGGKNEDNINNCLLQFITECLKDKVQQVALKSFQLCEAYASLLVKHKSMNPKAEVSYLEKMLAQLLDKLADNKYSQKAENAYFRFF